jgi:hypothetical protein
MQLSKRLPIATLVVAGAFAAVAASASAASTPPHDGPPLRVADVRHAMANGAPRHLQRRALGDLRRSARRSPAARAAVAGGIPALGCSSTSSSVWTETRLDATYGARTGEQVFVRRWLHIWSPTRDEWVPYGDAWQLANPSAYGYWYGTPRRVSQGEWVAGWLQTWSASTGWINWSLRPTASEPYGFLSLVRFSNEWCLPWP